MSSPLATLIPREILTTVDERKLLRLTARIQELARTVRRDSTESHVELGKRLAVVRELLGRGEWLRWVAEAKTFTDQAARNYMHLAAWAEERPRIFQAWKHLGTDKLYAIMKLDGAELRELQRRKRHAVPETDKVETLEEMSSAEVHRLVAEMRGAETARPIRRMLGSVRRSLKHMSRVAHGTRGRAPTANRNRCRELRPTAFNGRRTWRTTAGPPRTDGPRASR